MESVAKIGARISCEGQYGTVLYIGEVDSFEGTWLGVEWDNPSRGKHSGNYNGIDYFKTRVPNAGSFIRLKKADFGRPCPEAVNEKYGKHLNEKSTGSITLPQKSGKERQIEMIGFEKVMGKLSQFHRLTDVVVSGMSVNGPGAPGELEELIPNTRSLDLSCNLLSCWNDVIAIVSQLSQLQFLILSKNRLQIPINAENFLKYFDELETLILNNMAYSWTEVLSSAVMWPYIKSLDLCNNEITFLEEPPYPLFCQLSFLNLEQNPIGSWQEICKLGRLSNLQELYIDDVKLESISFPDVPPMEKTELFPNLVSLSVRNNFLSTWQDIGELNKLIKLKDLKVSNNPVIYSVNPETARQLVIAKITGLIKVNRTEIDKSERRGAEIDYIKRFHKDWIASGGHFDVTISRPSEDFLKQHPTYLSLLKKHGCAEESEVDSHCSLLRNNLLSIEIFSPLMPEKPPVIKKFPASMTVCKLKALMRRIFNTSTRDITLTCISTKGNLQETEMDNDMRQLSFYSISDRDKISVSW